jgi:hypothetical protein
MASEKCERCGMKINGEAERFLHAEVHREKSGDPHGLGALPFALYPCVAGLMQSYRWSGVQRPERAADQMLEALKLAYRKHSCGEESLGWTEVTDVILNAICEAIGDEGYQAWVETLDLRDNDESDHESIDDEGLEPTGSCDDCGVNLYGDEHTEGLCDQCSWKLSQG